MKKLHTPYTVHYKSLKDSDELCADAECGMLAQAMFHGTSQDWYVCNAHAAVIMAHWLDFELIDEAEVK